MKSTTRRIARGSKWPLLAIFALLACALVLAACGGGSSSSSESTTAAEEPAEETGTEEGEEAEGGAEEEEASGEPIVTMTYTDVNTEGPQYKNIEETERVYQEWIN